MSPLDFHVSPRGSDSFTATADAPLQNLQTAIDKLVRQREAGTTGPARILLHAGHYHLSQTVRIAGAALGDAASPLTISPVDDAATVTISGATRLQGFEPVPDQPGVWRLDLAGAGHPAMRFSQLFCDGVRMDLARFPDRDPQRPYDGGYLYREGEIVPQYENRMGEKDRFFISDPALRKRLAAWTNVQDVGLFIFPRFNWAHEVATLESFNADTGEVRISRPLRYEVYAGDRFYFFNVREELDAPGEWYLDQAAQVLYFRPPKQVKDPNDVVVSAPAVQTIIEVVGEAERSPERHRVGHVHLRGLIIENCDGTAVVVRDARACRISRCVVRNAGEAAIRIEDGFACGLLGCDISDTGTTAVVASGGYRAQRSHHYEPCDHRIENNYIHHAGVFDKGVAGVSIRGVGIHLRHNLIHDCPRFGINFHGNDHRIEFNHVRHIATDTSDNGAIHTNTRDLTLRGTTIRYNHVHDALGFGKDPAQGFRYVPRFFSFGIYLDDYASGMEVSGNLVYRTSRSSVHVHSGSENVIENNILLDSHEDALGLSDQGYYRETNWTGTRGYGCRRNVWRRNIIVPAPASGGQVYHLGAIMTSEFWPGSTGADPLPADGLAQIPGQVQHDGQPLPRRECDGDELPLLRWIPYNGSEDHRQYLGTVHAMREIDSEADQTMRWAVSIERAGRVWINGDLIFDNYATGGWDERAAADTRVLEVPLRKGRNVINIRCTAGFLRWRMMTGVPWAPHPVRFASPWVVFGPTWSKRFYDRTKTQYYRDLKDRFGSNVFDRNVFWCDGGGVEPKVKYDQLTYTLPQWRAEGFDADSVVADPKFVDPASDDYGLQPDSPALALGFIPLPVERMGPYESDDRASWPIVETPGAREWLKRVEDQPAATQQAAYSGGGNLVQQ